MRFPRITAVTKAAVSAVSSIFGDGARPASGDGFWGFTREPFAGAWQRGVRLDPIGELTAFSAVYACISRIANDIAKLRPRLMQEVLDGTWLPADKNLPHWIPLRRPNSYQNRIQFITLWLVYKLLYGNTYALKVRDDRNMVKAMYLLDPRRVTPMVTAEGDVYYSLGGDDLSRIPTGMVIPASEIIHDRCIALWHPLIGVSPIYASAASATQGRRIQSNSAQFFENMSRPSGMLTAPGKISDETAARLKKDWESNFGGQNIGRLAVLGDALKYEAMTVPAEQAQLIEQLKWTVEDVARAFCMPLYKIGAGAMPTNNNVEALNQQYYSDCLQTHIEAIELLLDEGLKVPNGQAVEFDLDGLLRMDTAAQVEMLTKAAGGAYMKVDEARKARNLPPVVGGDTIYKQHQDYSIEALAKRDASDDPFGTAKPAPAPQPPAAPAGDDPPKDDPAKKQAEIAAIVEMLVNKALAARPAEAAVETTDEDIKVYRSILDSEEVILA